MKIIVCVKQVPDSDTELIVDSATNQVRFAGRSAFKMNRYDEFAVETALRLQQHIEGAAVAAVSVGTRESADVVRRALGMGADHGILLTHRSEELPGQNAIAAAIAGLVKRDKYDLVLTGALSEDQMNATVGPMIAAHLKWPCAPNVVASKFSSDCRAVRVESEVEGGRRDLLEVKLPAVLTIQSGIHQPRYPKLSLMLRANQYPLDVIDMRATGPPAPREREVKIEYPSSARNGIYLCGALENQVEELIQFLKRNALLS